MGPKNGSVESADKVNRKDMKDFDHIQRSKQTKIGDKQQTKEQKKEKIRKQQILWNNMHAEAVPGIL